jgi:DNA-binding CsgD family transcriptional regulator
MDADPPSDVRLTDTQLAILAALCRPIAATDKEIADELSLGVDEVEVHLRTLYRKFGIDGLPESQKRARLVELAIDGGYARNSKRANVPLGSVEAIREAERATAAARPKSQKRSIGPYVTLAILILVVIAATLSISGIFNQGPTATKPPTPAAFRAEVDGDCKLALGGAPSVTGQGRTERARGYLDVIETVRGRLQSLVQPTLPDVALERFTTGLTTAANYTSDVAQELPAPGSEAEAKDVAELTYAAGQVQAGAVGYRLGHDCVAIGDLVARTAENAVAP